MAIISEFIYGTDPETGMVGYRPIWIKGGESTTGVAHDILEHFPNKNLPGVEGELMALGAMLALRIEQGATAQHISSEKELALLTLATLRWAIENNRTIKTPRTYSLHHVYDWAENVIQGASKLVYDLLIQEEQLDPEFMPERSTLEAAVVAWLRTGYRKALKRYDGLDLYSIGNRFFNDLDKFSERLDRHENISEGTRITFVVSPRNRTFSAYAHGRRIDA